jgi:transcriptional regulator with XRE-family HTH domain
MNMLLRQARLTLGLTQQQLADILGISKLSIWRWEQGQFPGPLLRQRLCSFFQKKERELGFAETRAVGMEHPSQTPTVFDPALPALLTPLIGRTALLSQLKTCLAEARGMISLLGLPGIGKTAMVQTLAADPEVQYAFPDGILWMHLGQDANLSQNLAHWALCLQRAFEPSPVPEQLDEQTARQIWGERIRHLIGTRRLLLLFDDVWSMFLSNWMSKQPGRSGESAFAI